MTAPGRRIGLRRSWTRPGSSSVVISDLFGVSGRDMLAALIRGERDPQVLADLARGRMRAKNDALVQALHGLFFTEHDAFVLSRMLARIDAITADITAVEERIDELITPFGEAVTRLCTIPGVGPSTAIAILAETGLDMSRFPTPQHLASWAKVSPLANESAGKTRGSRSTGKGNRYLAEALGNAVRQLLPHRDLPWRTLPAPSKTTRQEQGPRRRQPIHADRRLVHPLPARHDLDLDLGQPDDRHPKRRPSTPQTPSNDSTHSATG